MNLNKGKVNHIGKKDLSDNLDKVTIDISNKKPEVKKPSTKKVDPSKFKKAWDELENKLGFNKDTKLEEDMTKRNNPYVFEKDYEDFNSKLGFKIKNKLKKLGRGDEYSNSKNKKPLDGYEKLDHYDKKLTEDGEGGAAPAPVGDAGGAEVASSGGKMTLYNTSSPDNIGKSVDADGNPIYNSALVYKHQGLYSRGRDVKVPKGQKIKRIRIFKKHKSKKKNIFESPFYDLDIGDKKLTIDLMASVLYMRSMSDWLGALEKEARHTGFDNFSDMMEYIIKNSPEIYNVFLKILRNEYSDSTLLQLKRNDVREFINYFDIVIRKKLYNDVNDVWKFSKISKYL